MYGTLAGLDSLTEQFSTTIQRIAMTTVAWAAMAGVVVASRSPRARTADLEASIGAPAPQVVAKEFGDSAAILGIRFWIDRPSASRHARAWTAVIGAIKAAFKDAGIKIPYPQQELSGREKDGGFRIADESSEGGEEQRTGATPAPEDE